MMAICCQPLKGLETSKKLHWVDKISLAEYLQGSQGYLGSRLPYPGDERKKMASKRKKEEGLRRGMTREPSRLP